MDIHNFAQPRRGVGKSVVYLYKILLGDVYYYLGELSQCKVIEKNHNNNNYHKGFLCYMEDYKLKSVIHF